MRREDPTFSARDEALTQPDVAEEMAERELDREYQGEAPMDGAAPTRAEALAQPDGAGEAAADR